MSACSLSVRHAPTLKLHLEMHSLLPLFWAACKRVYECVFTVCAPCAYLEAPDAEMHSLLPLFWAACKRVYECVFCVSLAVCLCVCLFVCLCVFACVPYP